jgi:hypothetical protein
MPRADDYTLSHLRMKDCAHSKDPPWMSSVLQTSREVRERILCCINIGDGRVEARLMELAWVERNQSPLSDNPRHRSDYCSRDCRNNS